MALLLAVGPRLLPEYRDPNARPLDLVSAGLSVVAVLAVVYGLKQVAGSGLGWTPAVAIVAGVAVGAMFVRPQRALADPLIDLRLFRSSTFSPSLVATTLTFAVLFGISFFIAQYLQLVLGLSPLEAGLWTVPSAAGFIVGAMTLPALLHRVRPGFAVAGGLVVAAIGLALLTQADGTADLALVVVASVVLSLGAAAPITLGTDLVSDAFARSEREWRRASRKPARNSPALSGSLSWAASGWRSTGRKWPIPW